MGMEEVGVTACHQVGILDRLLDSAPLFLTGNTDTVYVSGILDLERDGPTVVEIPPGCGPTTVNDAWFRFITDMGRPGPDRGAGRQVPDRARGLRRADPRRVLRVGVAVTDQLADRCAACSSTASPTRRRRTSTRACASTRSPRWTLRRRWSSSPCPRQEFNTIHANDVSFFDELDAVIQREPLGVIDPEIRGLLASIGISKGTPFAPDDRMRALLTEAVAVANGTARAIAFKTRDPEAYRYPDRRWKTAFIGNDYRWLRDDGVGGRNLDARTLFFYLATVNTPAMALQHPRRRIAVRLRRARQPRRVPRRRQPLPAHRPARRPGQGLLVGRRLRPPDPIRAPDRPAVPEHATTRATRWPRTPTARSPSPSDRPRPTTTPATGSRPCPARSGSPSCGSTAPSSPGSTRPGSPATSNRSTPTSGAHELVRSRIPRPSAYGGAHPSARVDGWATRSPRSARLTVLAISAPGPAARAISSTWAR